VVWRLVYTESYAVRVTNLDRSKGRGYLKEVPGPSRGSRPGASNPLLIKIFATAEKLERPKKMDEVTDVYNQQKWHCRITRWQLLFQSVSVHEAIVHVRGDKFFHLFRIFWVSTNKLPFLSFVS
jgi:hypothetical protein